MLDTSNAVICHKCGWNHFGVDRTYAEQQSKEFLEWWLEQPYNIQQCYGEQVTYSKLMYRYEHCFRCGNTYPDTYVSKVFTSPPGSTIQPIIFPDQ